MTITKEQIKAILAHPVEAAAWAEGKEIEWRSSPGIRNWTATTTPDWFGGFEYRVKPEPMVYERWVNVYPGSAFFSYSSCKNATANAYSNRIACIHIRQEYEEGEGLE